MSGQEWLTVEQVAAAWQVHPETVRRAIRRKHLPAFTYGGVWRVRPQDRDEFTAKHMNTVRASA